MKRFHGTACFTAILVVCGVFLITGRGIAADTIKLGVAGDTAEISLRTVFLPVKAANSVKDINAKGGVLGEEVVLSWKTMSANLKSPRTRPRNSSLRGFMS